MTTVVVTLRIDEEDAKLIRQKGFNPAEIAQERLTNFARGIRVEQGMRRAQHIVKRMGGRPFGGAKAAREARDELDRRH